MNDVARPAPKSDTDWTYTGEKPCDCGLCLVCEVEGLARPAATVAPPPVASRARRSTKRTDPHRVGAIVPEDYSPVMSYALATTDGGHPVPSWRINCVIERQQYKRDENEKIVDIIPGEHDASGRCCWLAFLGTYHPKMAAHGGLGKCSVCGARFGSGDVWLHGPTGEHIHVGHDCADKYELLADRGDYNAAMDARKRGAAAFRLAEENRVEREAFLVSHPGLADDLKAEHHIVRDIAAKFRAYRSLSDAQVALVTKIANEARNPAPAEKHVAEPEGRVTVRGRIVSAKAHESAYGTSIKMTVKVETPDGSWLAWGTAPDCILGNAPIKGCEVEFSATLKRGNDAHFALFSRPTKARILNVQIAA